MTRIDGPTGGGALGRRFQIRGIALCQRGLRRGKVAGEVADQAEVVLGGGELYALEVACGGEFPGAAQGLEHGVALRRLRAAVEPECQGGIEPCGVRWRGLAREQVSATQCRVVAAVVQQAEAGPILTFGQGPQRLAAQCGGEGHVGMAFDERGDAAGVEVVELASQRDVFQIWRQRMIGMRARDAGEFGQWALFGGLEGALEIGAPCFEIGREGEGGQAGCSDDEGRQSREFPEQGGEVSTHGHSVSRACTTTQRRAGAQFQRDFPRLSGKAIWAATARWSEERSGNVQRRSTFTPLETRMWSMARLGCQLGNERMRCSGGCSGVLR